MLITHIKVLLTCTHTCNNSIVVVAVPYKILNVSSMKIQNITQTTSQNVYLTLINLSAKINKPLNPFLQIYTHQYDQCTTKQDCMTNIILVGKKS